MTAALADAKRLVMVVSRRYWTSVMATAEWTATFARDPALLLPVRIEEVTPPALLAPIVPVDLFGVDEAEARTRIVQALAGPGRSPQLVHWPGLVGAGWPSPQRSSKRRCGHHRWPAATNCWPSCANA